MQGRLTVVLDQVASSEVSLTEVPNVAAAHDSVLRFAGKLIPGLITHAPMPVLVCEPSRDHTPARSTSRVSTVEAILVWRQRDRRGAISGGLAGAPL